MRKTTFVALALSAAVMVMGAGYAAWTETVTINNSVSTGNLDVNMYDGEVTVTLDNGQPEFPIDRIATAIADNSGDTKETVTVDKLYPGTITTVNIPIKNEGTIKANISTFVSDLNNADFIVTGPTQPTAIAPGATEYITYTIEVPDSVTEENETAIFSLKATATQYNQ